MQYYRNLAFNRYITVIMRKILLMLCALGLCAGAYAQTQKCTVSGYIRDASTGETLIGAGAAAVISGKVTGAVTNDYGYYTLTIPVGKVSVTYSYVGCADVIKNLDFQKDTIINITLRQSTSLEAATAVARKDAGIQSTYMGALEIPHEILQNTPAIFGEPDVIKSLQLMPGVQSGMEGFSGIYVRGGGADENLMMLDGTPLYNVSHLFGLLSVFTPEAVKKVTFYKGSFPARYGGRISSIVDVRTNDGNAKEFHGSVSVGLLAEKLHFEGPIKNENTTFSFSARGMHTFAFDRLIKALGSPANYAFYDINGKVAHRFSDSDRLFFSFYTGRDYFRFDDTYKNDNTYGSGEDAYTVHSVTKTRAGLNWGNSLASIRWNHVFNSQLFANASATWNTYRMDLSTKMDETEEFLSQKDRFLYKYSYNSGIRDLGARIDFDYTPNPAHLVKFGGEFVHHVYRPKVELSRTLETEDGEKTTDESSNNSSPNLYGSEVSAYIEDDMSFGEHFSINPGLRLSLFMVSGKAYFRPEPRFAAKYSFGRGWAVKTAYSRMSQYVHQLTTGNLSLPTDLWVPITKEIEPVTSDLVSLGTYYSGLKGWEFSVEGYWKWMNNILEYKDGKVSFSSASNWEKNVEMGQGRSYGVEFYVQKTAGRTTGTASYTLSKSERIFPDGTINNGNWFPFVYDRRHNLSLSLNQKLGRRVDLSAIWTFTSGNWKTIPLRSTAVIDPDGNDVGSTDLIEGRNNYKLPPSHRLDLGLNIHKQKRHGERVWSFGLYNAYGARNPNWVVVDSYDKEVSSGKFENTPALHVITFLIFLPSFSYTFNF